jgi:type I restriction-modification system DNA methylase subunit
MSKKFDVVIGNPPYQAEAKGSGTRDTPVYHLFTAPPTPSGRRSCSSRQRASC